MLGFSAIGELAVGGGAPGSVSQPVDPPPESGMIDVLKIHPSRVVVFEGSGSRVTPFEGSGSRITRFE